MNKWRIYVAGIILEVEGGNDYQTLRDTGLFTEYVGEKCEPVDHRIKEFVVTPADLKILLDELQSVQNPDHELYQSWFEDSDREKWLTYIRSIYQTLKTHM